jgi:putative tryptophan/tyrosine transport system substrate-binding protein
MLAPELGADMRRREFITLLGGAVAWPLAAHAQQLGSLPTVGFLGNTTASVQSQWTAAFVQRLRELDWIDGRTVAIEYRWAEGRDQRAAEIATEFVRLKVDVIVTGGTALVIAVKQATSTIPIVFASAGDPVAAGLVASLARPGGNITGLSVQATDLAGKKAEMLREVVPGLRHLAIMANVGSPAGVLQMGEAQAAARRLGIEVAPVEIRQAEDIGPAIEAIQGHVDALYVANEPLVATHMARISALAMAARLPTMYGSREHVEVGGLISYAPSFPDLYRRAAEYVDKILRGSKPADIPVEQPTKFELAINLKTAKALGLTVPDKLLALADEVIE